VVQMYRKNQELETCEENGSR
jgi:hypothetical protein